METGIEVFLPNDVVPGYISCLPEQRLLDHINGLVASNLQNDKGYLVIRKPDISGRYTTTGELVYIKKANILFVKAAGGNGVLPDDSRIDSNIYPFVRKYPVKIECHISNYVLTGNIYCSRRIDIQNLVRKDLGFFPITEARIHHLRYNVSSQAGFVAVNKDRIHYMEESNHN
jgi:hypothetical protein